MKVLNYGSLNYDYVYEVDHINKPGETQSCQARNVFCGGKGTESVGCAGARRGFGISGRIDRGGRTAVFRYLPGKTELTHLILEERRDPVDMQSFSWIKMGKTAL